MKHSRTALYMLFALLWMFPLVLAVELFYRARTSDWSYQAFEARNACNAAQREFADAVIEEYTDPSLLAEARAFPKWEELYTMGPAEAQAFAQERGGVVYIVERDAYTIEAVYGAPVEPWLMPLASSLQTGASLFDVLGQHLHREAHLNDFMNMAREALWGPPYGPHERAYALKSDGEPEHLAVFVGDIQLDHQPFSGKFVLFMGPAAYADERWSRYRPNLRMFDPFMWSRYLTLFTNEHGLRGTDPITLPKPPDTFRIVCLGGSTTMEGDTEAVTYPALLERFLHDHHGMTHVEVVNAGVHGTWARTDSRRFQDILALEPDLILYLKFINDFREVANRWRNAEYDHLSLWNRFASAARESAIVREHFNAWMLPDRGTLEKAYLEEIFVHLLIMAERAKDNGCTFAAITFDYPVVANPELDEPTMYDNDLRRFMLFPLGYEGYRHAAGVYNELLKEWCERFQIPVLPFEQAFDAGARRYRDICHLHEHGIRDKALLIAEMVMGQGLIPRELPANRAGSPVLDMPAQATP